MATVRASTLSSPFEPRASSDSSAIHLRGIDTTGGTTDDDQAPAHAVESLPDGGYGWAVVAACSYLLFLVNGYNTAWGVL